MSERLNAKTLLAGRDSEMRDIAYMMRHTRRWVDATQRSQGWEHQDIPKSDCVLGYSIEPIDLTSSFVVLDINVVDGLQVALLTFEERTTREVKACPKEVGVLQ